MKVTIVYDGKCPVCRHVVDASRLRQRSDELLLLDARKESIENVQGLDLRSIDLDEGFAVITDGELHYGASGARVLALLTEPSGLMFRLFQRLVRTEKGSAFWYPIMRAGRNLLLRLLRIPRINEQKGPSQQ